MTGNLWYVVINILTLPIGMLFCCICFHWVIGSLRFSLWCITEKYSWCKMIPVHDKAPQHFSTCLFVHKSYFIVECMWNFIQTALRTSKNLMLVYIILTECRCRFILYLCTFFYLKKVQIMKEMKLVVYSDNDKFKRNKKYRTIVLYMFSLSMLAPDWPNHQILHSRMCVCVFCVCVWLP